MLRSFSKRYESVDNSTLSSNNAALIFSLSVPHRTLTIHNSQLSEEKKKKTIYRARQGQIYVCGGPDAETNMMPQAECGDSLIKSVIGNTEVNMMSTHTYIKVQELYIFHSNKCKRI